MADITEHTYKARSVSPARRVATIFGRRYPVGTDVTVYKTEGYTFDTYKDAEAFLVAPWPRRLPSGRYVTSDGSYQYPESKIATAKAHQARIDGEAR